MDLPEDISGAIQYRELTSLNANQRAFDRLEECLGFMDILGASDPDQVHTHHD